MNFSGRNYNENSILIQHSPYAIAQYISRTLGRSAGTDLTVTKISRKAGVIPVLNGIYHLRSSEAIQSVDYGNDLTFETANWLRIFDPDNDSDIVLSITIVILIPLGPC